MTSERRVGGEGRKYILVERDVGEILLLVEHLRSVAAWRNVIAANINFNNRLSPPPVVLHQRVAIKSDRDEIKTVMHARAVIRSRIKDTKRKVNGAADVIREFVCRAACLFRREPVKRKAFRPASPSLSFSSSFSRGGDVTTH